MGLWGGGPGVVGVGGHGGKRVGVGGIGVVEVWGLRV